MFQPMQGIEELGSKIVDSISFHQLNYLHAIKLSNRVEHYRSPAATEILQNCKGSLKKTTTKKV